MKVSFLAMHDVLLHTSAGWKHSRGWHPSLAFGHSGGSMAGTMDRSLPCDSSAMHLHVNEGAASTAAGRPLVRTVATAKRE